MRLWKLAKHQLVELSHRRCRHTSKGAGMVLSSMSAYIEGVQSGSHRRCRHTSKGAERVLSSMWPYIEGCRTGLIFDVGLHRRVQSRLYRRCRATSTGVERVASPMAADIEAVRRRSLRRCRPTSKGSDSGPFVDAGPHRRGQTPVASSMHAPMNGPASGCTQAGSLQYSRPPFVYSNGWMIC